MNERTPQKLFARPVPAALLCILLSATLGACSPDNSEQAARDGAGKSGSAAHSKNAVEKPTEKKVSGELAASGLLGRWTLVEIDGEPIEERYLDKAYLEFLEDGAVAGFAGVNRIKMRTSGDLAQGQLKFEKRLSTMMEGPPEIMAFERSMLTRLDSASSYQVSRNRLQIWSGDELSLELERSKT